MKKKINRRDFLKVMGVVGMTASLAACGDSGSSSAAASSTAGGDDGVITISYWTTDRHDQAYLTPLIEEYNKTNSDNIYIDYQVYADNYSQMLDLAFSTDTAPDVFKLSGTDPLEVQVDEKKMLLGSLSVYDGGVQGTFLGWRFLCRASTPGATGSTPCPLPHLPVACFTTRICWIGWAFLLLPRP